jgi:arginase
MASLYEKVAQQVTRVDAPTVMSGDCTTSLAVVAGLHRTGVPGLRFPAAGGPSLESVGAAVERVLATGRVVATGIACTWWPGHDAGHRIEPLLRLAAP